ncbi:MAG: ABC transporter permease [Phycisphaerae bacterium]|nr:ABC transporter permease [Gemmatimonadaceae bacterium]
MHHPQVQRILSRITDALLLLWLVTSLTFVLVHLAPGDAASLLVSPTATPQELAQRRAELGLDGSLLTQYGSWLASVLRGDLGVSMALSRPVTAVIADALPLSLALGGVSLALSFLVGVPIGAWQSAREGTRSDTACTILTTTMYAAPSFWLALALIAIATTGAAALNAPAWMRLPAFGVRDPAALGVGFDAFRDVVRHAALPLLVLSIPGAAGVARYARQTMIEARRAAHVNTAHARGIPQSRVTSRYVLRNAWPPLLVLLGLMLPGIVAGSVFVEQVFAWPGLGRAMMTAIASRDYPVVLALTMVYSATVIGANLLADVALLRVDPRRRSE